MALTVFDTLDLTLEGPVARISMRSGKVNAISRRFMADFNVALDRIEADQAASVLCISGRPGVFCVGADLGEIAEIMKAPDPGPGMRDFVMQFQQMNDRLEALAKMTVAEIDGATFGGGLELALACDIRVASQRSRFGLPEVRLGLIPAGGGTYRLRRTAGLAVARRMVLGCETLEAAAALAGGVIDRLFPTEGAEAGFAAHANELGRYPLSAILAGKACLGLPDAAAAVHETMCVAELASASEAKRRVADFLAQT